MFISCKDVIKIYISRNSNFKVPALRGLEIQIEKNNLVALIGPSGAGKTTLINLIGGLDVPSYGSIQVGEVNVSNLQKESDRIEFRRTHIGLVRQLPSQNLLGYLSALKNVMLPMKIVGIKSLSAQKTRAIELLQKVDLSARINHKPHQLSGGEAQRLSIAVALANDPNIILADEPTGELDSQNTLEIIEYFKYLQRELGKTIIVVTHNPIFATNANFTYRIMDGRVVSLEKDTFQQHREQSIFVDSSGNVQIPEEYRSALGITSEVQFQIENDRLFIKPKK